MNIKIIVATHKEYDMPSDDMYLPVFCGAKSSNLNLPYQRDDEGDNISEKNKYYCELTGLYWAWKNLDADYIGLNHYRRYFKYHNHLLTKQDAEHLLSKHDVILPKKRHYYIETVYSQYIHAHDKESIDKAREVIAQYYPGYLESFDICMNKRSLHLWNMFIMKRDIFSDYCVFLFDILNKVEQRIILQDRIIGFLSERLLDVYLLNEYLADKEMSMFYYENINWIKKIVLFFYRYIIGEQDDR